MPAFRNSCLWIVLMQTHCSYYNTVVIISGGHLLWSNTLLPTNFKVICLQQHKQLQWKPLTSDCYCLLFQQCVYNLNIFLPQFDDWMLVPYWAYWNRNWHVILIKNLINIFFIANVFIFGTTHQCKNSDSNWGYEWEVGTMRLRRCVLVMNALLYLRSVLQNIISIWVIFLHMANSIFLFSHVSADFGRKLGRQKTTTKWWHICHSIQTWLCGVWPPPLSSPHRHALDNTSVIDMWKSMPACLFNYSFWGSRLKTAKTSRGKSKFTVK